ncbi:Dolichol-phosphate mannosyltransferase subunit 1 [Entamoeba marina]
MSDLTVCVPTYNEVENMTELITGLEKVLDGINFDILVMDDNSPDGTGAKVEELKKSGHKCDVVIRKSNRGLSPSVIEGFERAQGDIIIVMDADLQHPISVVPKLYEAIKNGAEIAVGSRHCAGGGIEDWPVHRRIISWGAALLARPFTSISDPMSGFFAVKKSILKGAKLEAKGYKILLEVLVKTGAVNVVEVPITFTSRIHGDSKLTGGVMTGYIMHLIALFFFPGSAPLLKFLVVGATGTIVDIFIFSLLMAINFIPSIAQTFSFIAALCNNYFLNSLWTFPQSQGVDKKKQFSKFAIVSGVAFLIRYILFSIGRTFIADQFPYIQMLLFVVIATVTIINYLGSKLFVFNTN